MTETPASAPGLIGLAPIAGDVGTLIHIGQWLVSHPIARWFGPEAGNPKIEHAFVSLGDGTLIEAEPGGARIRPVTEYGDTAYWCNAIYATLDPGQGEQIATIARGFEGIPYSFVDYENIFLHRMHLPDAFLRLFTQKTGHMICSQLACQAYLDAGRDLFPGTWPGYIDPLEIWQLDQSLV